MPKIATQIPEGIYKNINEEVKLAIFSDVSEAVNIALKKTYARKSRAFLRWLLKKRRHNRSRNAKRTSETS